jgi:hypothetical protein
MVGLCQHYYALKCATVQYLVLHPVYLVLAEELLHYRNCVFSSALRAPNDRLHRRETSKRSATGGASGARHGSASLLKRENRENQANPECGMFDPRPNTCAEVNCFDFPRADWKRKEFFTASRGSLRNAACDDPARQPSDHESGDGGPEKFWKERNDWFIIDLRRSYRT